LEIGEREETLDSSDEKKSHHSSHFCHQNDFFLCSRVT
jgi:hypothetical protein